MFPAFVGDGFWSGAVSDVREKSGDVLCAGLLEKIILDGLSV